MEGGGQSCRREGRGRRGVQEKGEGLLGWGRDKVRTGCCGRGLFHFAEPRHLTHILTPRGLWLSVTTLKLAGSIDHRTVSHPQGL